MKTFSKKERAELKKFADKQTGHATKIRSFLLYKNEQLPCEWNSLDDTARQQLTWPGFRSFLLHKLELYRTGHNWANDAEAILKLYIAVISGAKTPAPPLAPDGRLQCGFCGYIAPVDEYNHTCWLGIFTIAIVLFSSVALALFAISEL